MIDRMRSELSPDDYMEAAINIYSHVFYMLLFIVMTIGKINDHQQIVIIQKKKKKNKILATF